MVISDGHNRYTWYVCVCVCVCVVDMKCRPVGVVAVDIALSDIEDMLQSSTPLGSRLHSFVVDRHDETVVVHPHFRNSFNVSPWSSMNLCRYLIQKNTVKLC